VKRISSLIAVTIGAGMLLAMGWVMLQRAGGVSAQEGGGVGAQSAVGTGFTYQGLLKDGSRQPVTGICDFRFNLWDSLSGGTHLGSPSTSVGVTVTQGYFTSLVNAGGEFGVSAFVGQARWLAIEVSCPTGSGTYMALTPRQALTPAPFAFALPGFYTRLTADNVNIVGGASNNVVSGAVGATLSGGGTLTESNRVTRNFGTISGGYRNTVEGIVSVVSGGYSNTVSGEYSVVSGGWFNTVTGDWAAAGGGHQNTVYGDRATVGGGYSNTASSNLSTIGGSHLNRTSNAYATVSGGWTNTAGGYGATVGGGAYNTASGQYATVGGDMTTPPPAIIASSLAGAPLIPTLSMMVCSSSPIVKTSTSPPRQPTSSWCAPRAG
jgi:hypothetical protein